MTLTKRLQCREQSHEKNVPKKLTAHLATHVGSQVDEVPKVCSFQAAHSKHSRACKCLEAEKA